MRASGPRTNENGVEIEIENDNENENENENDNDNENEPGRSSPPGLTSSAAQHSEHCSDAPQLGLLPVQVDEVENRAGASVKLRSIYILHHEMNYIVAVNFKEYVPSEPTNEHRRHS